MLKIMHTKERGYHMILRTQEFLQHSLDQIQGLLFYIYIYMHIHKHVIKLNFLFTFITCFFFITLVR